MSITPRITAFQQRYGRKYAPVGLGSGSLPVDGGDGGPIGLMVELYLNGMWTDISRYVYYANRIRISRGRPNETSRVQPQACALTINNRDGRFSPRNANGAYYLLIGRNTPIRVSRLNNGVRRYRYHGEVPSWPRNSDITGRNVTVGVNAAGMLRRLRQGTAPIGSALRRAYTAPQAAHLTAGGIPAPLAAYWPCEDGMNATSIASAIAGGPAMILSGQAPPSFGRNSDFACSDPLPLLSGSIWTGAIPTYTGGTDNIVNLLLSVPATGAFDTAVVARILTAGTVARVDIQYFVTGGGSLVATGYSGTGATLFTSTALGGLNGVPLRASLQLTQFGSWSLQVKYVGKAGGNASSGSLVSSTIGNVTSVVINPAGNLNDTALGHVVVEYSVARAVDDTSPLIAWRGDTPDIADAFGDLSRFSRLCTEQNIPAVVIQGPAGYDSTFSPTHPAIGMGYQLSDTFENLLQQPVDQSLGLLYEARDQLALTLRTRGSLYNQTAKLTLDYSQHQLSEPLVPLDDDAFTRNDITVTQIGGSSAVATLTTGALSVQPPPAGVGGYPTNYPISLLDSAGLADHAGWRLHMGTVDEPRYPQVSLNLRHPTFTTDVDMMNAALTLDIGDRIVIKNLPTPDFPPDDISLIVQGYSETLGIWEHDMVLNCTPESPYRVGILDDDVLGRLDTDGSTLAGDISATATTFQVTTTGAATGSPLWTTDPAEFPFDVMMGGERMTVTNITGSSSPQTFFVTRSANSVAKAQTAGTDIRLQQPMILSM